MSEEPWAYFDWINAKPDKKTFDTQPKPLFKEDYHDLLGTLKYFWEEKRDLECCSSFNDNRQKIRRRNPEIIKAWEDYKASIKILSSVLQTALDNTRDEEDQP